MEQANSIFEVHGNSVLTRKKFVDVEDKRKKVENVIVLSHFRFPTVKEITDIFTDTKENIGIVTEDYGLVAIRDCLDGIPFSAVQEVISNFVGNSEHESYIRVEYGNIPHRIITVAKKHGTTRDHSWYNTVLESFSAYGFPVGKFFAYDIGVNGQKLEDYAIIKDDLRTLFDKIERDSQEEVPLHTYDWLARTKKIALPDITEQIFALVLNNCAQTLVKLKQKKDLFDEPFFNQFSVGELSGRQKFMYPAYNLGSDEEGIQMYIPKKNIH